MLLLIFLIIQITLINASNIENTSIINKTIYIIDYIKSSKVTRVRFPKGLSSNYQVKVINFYDIEPDFLYEISLELQAVGIGHFEEMYKKLIPDYYKMNLLSYAILYLNGGIYLDNDFKLSIPIDQIVKRFILESNYKQNIFICEDINARHIKGVQLKFFDNFIIVNNKYDRILYDILNISLKNIKEGNYNYLDVVMFEIYHVVNHLIQLILVYSINNLKYLHHFLSSSI